MNKGNRYTGLILVLIAGLALQGMFIVAESEQNNPAVTVQKFARAYYNIDPSMMDYLCVELAPDEIDNPATRFLREAEEKARATGHDTSYMRSKLYHLHTKSTPTEDGGFEVHLTAERKKNINPVFTIVGKLFALLS